MSNDSEEAAIMRRERALARVDALPRQATGPARHFLKTHPEPFRALAEGRKTHEYRKDDRGYEVGDMLVLRKWDPETDDYLPPGAMMPYELIRWVTYISRGPAFGIPEDYCVMSVSEKRPTP